MKEEEEPASSFVSLLKIVIFLKFIHALVYTTWAWEKTFGHHPPHVRVACANMSDERAEHARRHENGGRDVLLTVDTRSGSESDDDDDAMSASSKTMDSPVQRLRHQVNSFIYRRQETVARRFFEIFPPFGFSEVFVVLFLMLTIFVSILSAFDQLNSTWASYASWAPAFVMFFGTFGVRNNYLGIVIVVFGVGLASWSISNEKESDKIFEHGVQAGVLIFAALGAGWIMRVIVISSYHCGKHYAGQNFRLYLQGSGGSRMDESSCIRDVMDSEVLKHVMTYGDNDFEQSIANFADNMESPRATDAIAVDPLTMSSPKAASYHSAVVSSGVLESARRVKRRRSVIKSVKRRKSMAVLIASELTKTSKDTDEEKAQKKDDTSSDEVVVDAESKRDPVIGPPSNPSSSSSLTSDSFLARTPRRLPPRQVRRSASFYSHQLQKHSEGRLGIMHQDVGFINLPGRTVSIGSAKNGYFPTFRLWELVGVVLTIGCLIVVVVVEAFDVDVLSSEEQIEKEGGNYYEAIMRGCHFFSLCISICRFDPTYLLWTIILTTSMFVQALMLLLFATGTAGHGGLKPYNLTQIGIVVLAFIWLLRGVGSFNKNCWGRFMSGGRRRQRDVEQTAYEKQLRVRGFQSGDVLVTGSNVLGPSSFLAQWGTLAPWGHVAVILRRPDRRLRAAFGLASILSKFGFFLKGELASMIHPRYARSADWRTLGRTEKCRRLALITARDLTRKQLKDADSNAMGGGGRLLLQYISAHLDLKGGPPLEQREMFQKWLNKYDHGRVVRFGFSAGQKRYVRWMRRSPSDLYVVEAIGTGTRMMTIERFFKFWWKTKRERVAWRPLYSLSSERRKRPTLTFQSAMDLFGQKYVDILSLVLVALRIATSTHPEYDRASKLDDLSRMTRRRFFCSEFATAVLKRMDVVDTDVVLDAHVQPGDFGSDYGAYPMNNLLKDEWQFAELVYVVGGLDGVIYRDGDYHRAQSKRERDESMSKREESNGDAIEIPSVMLITDQPS